MDGQSWRVRLNDFPDELMYGLVIGDELVGNFHDWPERPGSASLAAGLNTPMSDTDVRMGAESASTDSR